MKRAALYVRVSTAEQKKYGLSVDSQIDALRKYCKTEKIKEVGLYNDAGISARKKYTKRPALLQLIDDCKAGKIDIILFTKLDRWFRSVADYYAVQTILDASGVAWNAIWEDYETETSAGQFKVNIMLAVAQSEADRTSERIKAVNDFRRDRGDYLGGTAPLGFKKENNKLVQDPETWPGLLAFLTAYADYKSMDECYAAAVAAGAHFSRNTGYRYLHNDFILSFLSDDQRAYIKSRQSGSRTRKPIKIDYNYLFQGLPHCAYCGHAMTANGRRRSSGKRGDYIQRLYQCHNYVDKFTAPPCPEAPAINEDILERLLLEQLEPALNDYKIAFLDVQTQKSVSSALTRSNALKSRLTRLQDLYTMGDLNIDDYKIKRDEIKKELAEVNSIIEMPAAVPDLPDNWRDIYAGLSTDSRRIFWHKMIKKILVYKDHKIKIIFN